MKPAVKLLFITLVFLGVAASTARAATITYVTPSGSESGGLPVDVQATFTTTTDTITVVLENLESDITSIVQNVSDLRVTPRSGHFLPGPNNFISSSGQERTVNTDGTYTDGAVVDTGWSLTTQGTDLYLDVLASPVGPGHTIIGPAGGPTYSTADTSIAGNNQVNPFLVESATFVINVPGITGNSSISSAIFSFGREKDAKWIIGVPEPASWVLAVTALVGLLGWRRRLSFPSELASFSATKPACRCSR